jgi:hypothetical protein
MYLEAVTYGYGYAQPKMARSGQRGSASLAPARSSGGEAGGRGYDLPIALKAG